MSPINDEAAKKYDEERRRVDTSPAQPPDDTRIDPDDGHAKRGGDEPHAHVKDDDAHRMEN